MCRLLGIVSSEHTDFRFSLHEAPRSLARLSREHPDGWGIAVWDEETGWQVERAPVCAALDGQFHATVVASRGEVLLAHVRKRTVGVQNRENTHPFRRGRWVFAHNGTIDQLAFLERGTSSGRRSEIVGDTDSELLLAYLLTALDAVGAAEQPAGEAADQALWRAVAAIHAQPDFGATNFLLSDGDVVYAHRAGRSLFLLDRGPGDPVQVRRRSAESGAVIDTPWTRRRRAVLVASERLSDEPWTELGESTLLRIDRRPEPGWHALG